MKAEITGHYIVKPCRVGCHQPKTKVRSMLEYSLWFEGDKRLPKDTKEHKGLAMLTCMCYFHQESELEPPEQSKCRVT